MNKYRILGAPCFQVENVEASKIYIKNLLNSKKGGYSTAINAEKIMMYSKDNEMRNVLENSILPVPDGSGAVLGMKLLYNARSIRLDLPRTIFELADSERYRLFILGASEENNSKAVKEIKRKYPNSIIVGRENGFFTDEDRIIREIEEKKPHIVFVALGSPKQEKFAARVNKKLPQVLFIGCGGALDILAGKVTRAPKFYQDNHLEWFYRLSSEPKRIRRQKILPVYMSKLLLEAAQSKVTK